MVARSDTVKKPKFVRFGYHQEAEPNLANGAGLPCSALLTDMNQCLGRKAGNALEVRESVDHLTGAAHNKRLLGVTLALAGELLAIGGLSTNAEAGRARAEEALRSGRAAEYFARMVTARGGPADFMDRMDAHLPKASVAEDIAPERAGIITSVDGRALGLAIIDLGGGRRHAEDSINYAVGLSNIAAIGESVGEDQPLCTVHAANNADAARAALAIRAAITIGENAPLPAPLIRQRVGLKPS